MYLFHEKILKITSKNFIKIFHIQSLKQAKFWLRCLSKNVRELSLNDEILRSLVKSKNFRKDNKVEKLTVRLVSKKNSNDYVTATDKKKYWNNLKNLKIVQYPKKNLVF